VRQDRVVFDTNMYVMAAPPKHNYASYWLTAAEPAPTQRLHLFVSEPILTELTDVLTSKFETDPEMVREYVDSIRHMATVVKPTETVSVVDRDPDDNKILECALAAQADYVITADKDLLKLKRFRGIAIYHPSNLKYFFPESLDAGEAA